MRCATTSDADTSDVITKGPALPPLDRRAHLELGQGDAPGVPFVLAAVKAGSTVHADEASHWEDVERKFLTKRINHSVEYSTPDACTNQAESFFSRLRGAEIGIHYHIAGPYLAAYATEMAWREDNRRISNGEQFLLATSSALAHPVSRQWKGYWQRAAN